jgi:hypothetical protein
MNPPCFRLSHLFTVLLPIFAWVVLLTSYVRECFAQETSLKERFLAEAPGKIDEYAKYCRRLQGSATLTVDRGYHNGKKEHAANRFEFKQNVRCTSFSIAFASTNQKGGKLSAVNPDYSFQLKGADSGNAWVVTTIEGPESTLEWPKPLPDVVLNRIMPQYHFDELLLSNILRSSEFVVDRAEPVTQDGHSLARITFTYRQQEKPTDRGYCPVQGGSMLLDADHYWRPLERTLNCKWVNGAGPVKERFEYTEGSRGFYILKRRFYNYQLTPNGSKNPDPWESESVWEYDLREASSLPKDSEFTLSAYGLPEPPHLRRSTPWYLWALGGGAVCLVLGFLVHRRIRRGN